MRTVKRRGGYGLGNHAYSKLIKVRVAQQTYDKLLDVQEIKQVSMSHLLRLLIDKSLQLNYYPENKQH